MPWKLEWDQPQFQSQTDRAQTTRNKSNGPRETSRDIQHRDKSYTVTNLIVRQITKSNIVWLLGLITRLNIRLPVQSPHPPHYCSLSGHKAASPTVERDEQISIHNWNAYLNQQYIYKSSMHIHICKVVCTSIYVKEYAHLYLAQTPNLMLLFGFHMFPSSELWLLFSKNSSGFSMPTSCPCLPWGVLGSVRACAVARKANSERGNSSWGKKIKLYKLFLTVLWYRIQFKLNEYTGMTEYLFYLFYFTFN